MDRRSRGFSLIELVVTIVIVAILASIAIPSYQTYVLKSHRTDAKTALLDMASLEERYFSAQNAYSQLPTDLGYTTPAFPVIVGNGYYQVSLTTFTPATPPTALVPAGTPAYYQFTATPLGVQVNDTACTSFVLDSKGVQTATGADPNPNVDCWN